MFKKILIANRGEIAVRVMNTCKDMGIRTVAVYSEADEKAAHVLFSDEAVCLGASEPGQSYLNIDAVIEAAKKTGAKAIHPGYGFLSENHEFAARCEKEGIVFIGPSSHVIRQFGDKITALSIMEQGNVPVTPGVTIDKNDPQALLRAAREIGYPVMVKATAGGGGKGIRVVESEDTMEEALDSAAREAKTAFGNGVVYIEKFFTKARHIEFQVLADRSGKTVHLYERECSIQRRHQKIIEETPSTVLTDELRLDMGKAAVRAAKAAGYENAGTVEFLVDELNRFYFLEINTRLQVEHPVTEETCGVDLVRHQIEIASGMPLELEQGDITPKGHSIECRIYAEDPQNGFMPSPGKIRFLKTPSGPGIRNDSGVYQGVDVPVEYDPILSKLVVWANDREQAIEKMIKALQDYIVLGVKTPVAFLMDLLDSDPFRQGDVFTDFIDTHFPEWMPENEMAEAAAAAFIADSVEREIPHSLAGTPQAKTPWQTLGRWEL